MADPDPLSVEVPSVEALLDPDARKVVPHRGPMLAPGLADFWESVAREERFRPGLNLRVRVRGPSARAEAEEGVRAAVHDYFATETGLAERDVRVNRGEGWGALRAALPLLVIASVLAGVFYYLVPSLDPRPGVAALSALPALLFAVITWVLLWDPIEKLLFDSYLLRRRCVALEKLSRATLLFDYTASAPAPRTAESPAGQGPSG